MAIPPAALPPPYMDRRGILIAFGVVQMLIGALLLLMTLVMLLIPVSEVGKGQPEPISKAVLAGVGLVFYGVPAIVFIALGVGSVMAKNWARIGTLVVSWTWLGLGVLNLAFVVFLMPAILRSMPTRPDQPESFSQALTTIAAIVIGLCFVLLPAIFLAVYHSKHVKATCTAGRLTPQDAKRPAVMMVLAIWMGMGVLSILFILFSRYPAVVFGVVISGIWGKLVYLATGLVYGWASFGIWRRQLLAWRITLWLQLQWLASGATTFVFRDAIQVYREMGM